MNNSIRISSGNKSFKKNLYTPHRVETPGGAFSYFRKDQKENIRSNMSREIEKKPKYSLPLNLLNMNLYKNQ